MQSLYLEVLWFPKVADEKFQIPKHIQAKCLQWKKWVHKLNWVHGLGTFSLVCSKKSKSTVFSYEAVYRPVHKKTVLLDLAKKKGHWETTKILSR